MIYAPTKSQRPELDARGIGQRIRSARKARKWRHRDLADAVGLKPATVACWESGARIPETRTLALLSFHLRRTTDWILFGLPKHARIWSSFAAAR